MAADEGRGGVTAKALWAHGAQQRRLGERGSSPDSAKSSAEPRQRWKRAKKPKVRTGCLSCKRRHLKCDERKEGGCMRCESFGIACEGYASPKPVKETKPARVERFLLPRPKLAPIATGAGVPDPAATASIPTPTIAVSSDPASACPPESMPFPENTRPAALPPLLRPPPLLLEWSDEDNFYWSLFQYDIVRSLSPHFESNFWRRLLLREGVLNDCIRHSILSIGAYCRAIETARDASPSPRHGLPEHPNWINTRRNRHHHAALHHHSKALGHLRQKMGSPLTDTRLTMMATLLFIAFENMQGNYHASGSLIRSGIKVLGTTALGAGDTLQPPPAAAQMLPQPPPLSPASADCSLPVSPAPQPCSPADEEDVAEMTQMFARLSTSCVYLPFPHCRFAYHLLLDPRLTDPRANRHLAGYPTTLEQARAAWDFYLPVLGDFFQKATWHNLNHAYEFDMAEAVREQADHLAWLRRFGTVLQLLRMAESERTHAGARGTAAASRRPGMKPGYEAASPAGAPMNRGLEMLSIQHLVATIFTTCCLDNTEMLYDAFVPQFGEILARCQVLFAHVAAQAQEDEATASPTAAGRASKLGFSNEAGLLPLLGFVASKCRSRAVRLEALALVGRCECREGNWDSRSLTNGMAALIGLEEMGLDVLTGQIPGDARFVWTNSWWDAENRSMAMQFTRVLPNELGEYETRELTAGL